VPNNAVRPTVPAGLRRKCLARVALVIQSALQASDAMVEGRQIDLICAAFPLMLHEQQAVQNGGSGAALGRWRLQGVRIGLQGLACGRFPGRRLRLASRGAQRSCEACPYERGRAGADRR
jgi:hypothetical protein